MRCYSWYGAGLGKFSIHSFWQTKAYKLLSLQVQSERLLVVYMVVMLGLSLLSGLPSPPFASFGILSSSALGGERMFWGGAMKSDEM